MSKEIKGYLHLYLGCEAAIGYNPKEKAGMRIDIITGVSKSGAYTSNGDLEIFSEVKPILRPLSDMTKEEEKEIFKKINPTMIESAEEVRLLLSKHFDLFSLIESELAIDATKEERTRE